MIFAEMWRKKMLAMNESDRTRTINGSLNEYSARQCGIDKSSQASRCCNGSREVRGWKTRATETHGRRRQKEQGKEKKRLLTRGDRVSRRCTVSAWCWSCRRRQPRGKSSACSRSCLLHDGLHTKRLLVSSSPYTRYHDAPNRGGCGTRRTSDTARVPAGRSRAGDGGCVRVGLHITSGLNSNTPGSRRTNHGGKEWKRCKERWQQTCCGGAPGGNGRGAYVIILTVPCLHEQLGRGPYTPMHTPCLSQSGLLMTSGPLLGNMACALITARSTP
jgi:hypothetical protein